MLINLKHAPGLAAFVRAVSDPHSVHYRQYATVEQLTARFGAKPGARRHTVRYLQRHGLRAQVGPGAAWVLASGSAAQVAGAFPAGRDARAARASGRLTVPAALRASVSSAGVLATRTPTARAAADAGGAYNGLSDRVGSALPHSGTAAGCQEGANAISQGGTAFTPNQLAAAYGLDVLHKRGLQGQGMHIALVETGGFHRSDVETFATCFGITMPKLNVTNVAGGKLLPVSSMEETLDVEVLLGALPKLAQMDVYEAAEPHQTVESDLLRAVAAALGTKGRHPDAISISYGLCEPLQIGIFGAVGTARAMDTIMQVAAGAGISVAASSGDSGYAGCAREVPAVIPSVSLPSSLPHVTAVGGTDALLAPDNHIIRETPGTTPRWATRTPVAAATA